MDGPFVDEPLSCQSWSDSLIRQLSTSRQAVVRYVVRQLSGNFVLIGHKKLGTDIN